MSVLVVEKRIGQTMGGRGGGGGSHTPQCGLLISRVQI